MKFSLYNLGLAIVYYYYPSFSNKLHIYFIDARVESRLTLVPWALPSLPTVHCTALYSTLYYTIVQIVNYTKHCSLHCSEASNREKRRAKLAERSAEGSAGRRWYHGLCTHSVDRSVQYITVQYSTAGR